MPVSALPAMRAAIAYSAPATSGNTWADYASTMFDSLLALEFRNAPSLAAATLYGSTPTIEAQPAGGLDLTANGIVCNEDTYLSTTFSPADISPASAYALIYDWSGLNFYSHVLGANAGSGIGFLLGKWGTTDFRLLFGNTTTSVDYQSATAESLPFSCGVIGSNIVQNGSVLSDLSATITSTDQSNNFYILSRNTGDRRFIGTLSALMIGTLKAGADADTVASELHTRMQTGAL